MIEGKDLAIGVAFFIPARIALALTTGALKNTALKSLQAVLQYGVKG